jgi:hypothetical protein
MNLGVTWVCHEGPAFVGTEGGHHITPHGVGGEIENVSVATSCQNDSVCGMSGDFTSGKIANNDALGVALDDDKVEHLSARMHGDTSAIDFLFERLVATNQELLASLASGIKCPLYLSSAERTVVEESAVFSGEGDTLCNALVDNLSRNLSKPVNVCFTRSEVATFDCVVKEPVN